MQDCFWKISSSKFGFIVTEVCNLSTPSVWNAAVIPRFIWHWSGCWLSPCFASSLLKNISWNDYISFGYKHPVNHMLPHNTGIYKTFVAISKSLKIIYGFTCYENMEHRIMGGRMITDIFSRMIYPL